MLQAGTVVRAGLQRGGGGPGSDGGQRLVPEGFQDRQPVLGVDAAGGDPVGVFPQVSTGAASTAITDSGSCGNATGNRDPLASRAVTHAVTPELPPFPFMLTVWPRVSCAGCTCSTCRSAPDGRRRPQKRKGFLDEPAARKAEDKARGEYGRVELAAEGKVVQQ